MSQQNGQFRWSWLVIFFTSQPFETFYHWLNTTDLIDEVSLIGTHSHRIANVITCYTTSVYVAAIWIVSCGHKRPGYKRSIFRLRNLFIIRAKKKNEVNLWPEAKEMEHISWRRMGLWFSTATRVIASVDIVSSTLEPASGEEYLVSIIRLKSAKITHSIFW